MKPSRKTGLLLLTGFILFLVGCGGNTPTIGPTITAIEPTITATVPTITVIEPTITTVVTASGLRVGAAAPDFTLPDGNGKMVRLTDELKDHKLVVLVFYHPDT